MSRLVATGFETRQYGAIAACAEGQGVFSSGSVTANTEHQYDGSVCAKCASSSNSYVGIENNTANINSTLGRTYYFQAAISLSSDEPSETLNILNIFANKSLEVLLTEGGQIVVWNNVAAKTEISTEFYPGPNSQYLYEVKLLVPSSSNSTLALRIYDDTDTLVYESGDKSISFGNTKITFWEAGRKAGTEKNVTAYVSHLILNDNQGEKESSYIGPQRVVMLRPISDAERTGFTGGGGATTNLYDALNNYPPVGVANGSKTNASQIYSAGNNTTDKYRALTASYSASIAEGGGGIASWDTVQTVMGIARGSNSSSTARNLELSVASNPSITEVAKATSGTASTEPTGWVTITTGVAHSPSITVGTGTTPHMRKGTASTDAMAYDMAGVYVTYTKGEEPEHETIEGAATLSGKGSLSAKGVRVVSSKSSLTGSSSLSIKGTRIRPGAVSLKGTSSISVSGLVTKVGKSSLTGTGTLASRGVREAFTKASLTSSGSLTAKGIRESLGQTSLVANSELDAYGIIVRISESHLTAAGLLTAKGSGGSTLGRASLSANSSMEAKSTVTRYSDVSLSAESILESQGLRISFGSTNLTSHGDLAASGLRTSFGEVNLSALALLQAEWDRNIIKATAALEAESSLQATSTRITNGLASLSSASEISAKGHLSRIGKASLTALSSLTSSANITAFGIINLAGYGKLSGEGIVVERIRRRGNNKVLLVISDGPPISLDVSSMEIRPLSPDIKPTVEVDTNDRLVINLRTNNVVLDRLTNINHLESDSNHKALALAYDDRLELEV